MTTDVRTELLKSADEALTNRHGRPFITAVRMFVTTLRRVPGAGQSEFSLDQLAVIRDLAEGVVTEIEDRLEDADDSSRIQLELARAVFAIRRALEEIGRWERHSALNA